MAEVIPWGMGAIRPTPSVHLGPDPKGPSVPDLFNGFAHHFSEHNIFVQAVQFARGETWLQKSFEVGKQYAPRDGWNPAQYDPIISGPRNRLDFLMETKSPEEADHMIRLLDEKEKDEAKYNDIGVFGFAGALSGFVLDPVEWPLFFARTPKMIMAGTAALAGKEGALTAVNPQSRTPGESAFNVVAGAGLTFAAVQLHRRLVAGGSTPQEAAAAARRFDEINSHADVPPVSNVTSTNFTDSAGKPVRNVGVETPEFQAERFATKAQVKQYVSRKANEGVIQPEDVSKFEGFVDILPDTFWSGVAIRLRQEPFTDAEVLASGRPPRSESVAAGVYDNIHDLITVFTGTGRIGKKGKRYEGAPRAFRHETGHRVFQFFASKAEIDEARAIFNSIPDNLLIDAEFLKRYSKREHFGEWFAESFNRYWDDILEGRAAAPKEGLVGIYQRIAGRVREFIHKIAINAASSGPKGYKEIFVFNQKVMRSLHAHETVIAKRFFDSLTLWAKKVDVDQFLEVTRRDQKALQAKFGRAWEPSVDRTKHETAAAGPIEVRAEDRGLSRIEIRDRYFKDPDRKKDTFPQPGKGSAYDQTSIEAITRKDQIESQEIVARATNNFRRALNKGIGHFLARAGRLKALQERIKAGVNQKEALELAPKIKKAEEEFNALPDGTRRQLIALGEPGALDKVGDLIKKVDELVDHGIYGGRGDRMPQASNIAAAKELLDLVKSNRGLLDSIFHKRANDVVVFDLEDLAKGAVPGSRRLRTLEGILPDEIIDDAKATLQANLNEMKRHVEAGNKRLDELPPPPSLPPSEPPPMGGKPFASNELEPAKGLEHLGDAPGKRTLHPEASPVAKNVSPRLVELPYYLRRHFLGLGGAGRGVDRMTQIKWIAPMVEAMKATDNLYNEYRVRVAAAGDGGMTRTEFYQHVGRAKKALDDPDVAARFEQEAVAAANEWQLKVYGPAGREAKALKMFSIGLRRDLAQAKTELKTAALDSPERGALEAKISELEVKIKEADNTEIKSSFLNRIYDKNAVAANESRLFQVLLKYGRTPQEARNSIKGILGQRDLPIEEEILGHGHEAVGRAASLRTRTLDDIPDSELDFVLESNITAVGKYYATRMGGDIELVREFRSIDLWDELRAIERYWDNRLRAGKGSSKMADEAFDLSIAETGKPLTIQGFRGTSKKKGESVSFGGIGGGSGAAMGEGIYVATSFSGARQFGQVVHDLVVDLKNPLVLRSDEDLVETLRLMGVSEPQTYILEPWIKWKKANNIGRKDPLNFGLVEFQKRQQKAFDDINAWARSQGHDGIVVDLGGAQSATRTKKQRLAGGSSIHKRLGNDQIVVFDEVSIVADRGIIEQGLSVKATKEIEKRRDQELEDIRVMRDRHRGTYGLPDNPESYTNRGIRVGKMVVASTLLTGALAQLPDIAMIPMVNGFRRTFGASFETLFSGLDQLKLSLKDAQLAGEALDWYLSTRAALFADLSDVMGTTTKFERTMSKGTQMFFNVSGMNPWNVGVKTLASLMAGSRIYDEAVALVAGKATRGQLGRLGRANIGLDEAKAIVAQFDQHGLKGNYVRIGRVGEWTDEAAREAYLAALGHEINMTIITPGKGEIPNMLGGGLEKLPGAKARKIRRDEALKEGRPLTQLEEIEDLFMGGPISQMIFQFKTFTASAGARIMTPGLQHADMDTLMGAVTLVALGGMVDSIRRWQLDIEGGTTAERLWGATQRSAILGWAGDVPSIMAQLAGPNSSVQQRVGAVGGPIVQQGSNASRVLLDVVSGTVDEKTVDSGFDLLPMANVFYLDGVMGMARRSAEQMVR
jgi:hypothetical protein